MSRLGKILTLVLFFSAFCGALKVKAQAYNLTQLIEEFETSQENNAPDTTLAWLASRICYEYIPKDFKRSTEYADKMVAYQERYGDHQLAFDNYSLVGKAYINNGYLNFGVEILLRALNHGKAFHSLSAVGYIYNDMGNAFYRTMDYDKALELYKDAEEALQSPQTRDDKLCLSTTLNNIGLIRIRKKQFLEAEKVILRSTNIRLELGDKPDYVAYNYDILTSLALEMHQPEKALTYSRLGIQYVWNKKTSVEWLDIFIGVMVRRIETFGFLQMTDSLENSHRQLIRYFKQLNESQDFVGIYTSLGGAYKRAGKLDFAAVMFDSALYYGSDPKAFRLLPKAYAGLKDIYRLKGDYQKALKYAELEKSSLDSIHNKTVFDRLRKSVEQDQLASLEKELAVKNSQIDKERSYNIVMMVLVVVIATAKVLLIWALFRLRNVNKEIKRTRIQMQTNTDNLDALINNSNDYIWSVDRSLRYITLNKKASQEYSKLIGYQVFGGAMAVNYEAMDLSLYEFWDANYNRAFSGEKFVTELRREGRIFQISFNPIVEKDGNSGVAVFAKDVTETVSLYETIKQSEARLKSIMENANASIWAVDADYRIIFMNSQFTEWMRKVYGVKIRLGDKALGDPKLASSMFFKGIYDRGLSGENFRMEWEDRSRSGELLTFEAQVSPITNSDNSLLGTTLLVIDITDRKKVESEISRAKNYLEFAQKLARMGNYRYDLQTRKVVWSDEVYIIFGLPVGAELPDLDSGFYESLNHPDDRDMTRDKVDEAIDKGQEITYIHRIIVEGNIRYAQTIVKCFYNKENQPSELFGTILDITEIKNAEQRLQETNQRLAQATSAAGMGVWEWAPESDRLFWDHTLYQIYGIDLSTNISGNLFYTLIHPEDRDTVVSTNQKAIQGELTDFGYTFRAINPVNGAVKYIASSAQVYRDAKGKTERIVGLNWDITEEKTREKELISAKNKAEEAAQAKSMFLSTMSHEIRTPLNAVIGTTHFLLQEAYSPEQKEHLENLRFASENLLRLINDILDYNKLESDRVLLEQVDFKLRDMVVNLSSSLSYKASENNNRIEVNYDEAIPDHLIGDPMRISQVLNNLLSNAIKFTKNGQITITVRLEGDSKADIVPVYFEVKDTGIGIPNDKLNTVFEVFSQADASTTRKFGGTGLGLAITRKLIEQHGSQIRLDSTLGGGTKFWFTLNFKKSFNQIPATTTVAASPRRNLKGYIILVVDDNDMNLKLVERFLKKWEATCALARSGPEAINQASEQYFDMILMDLQMPDMDGIEATRKIRALPNPWYGTAPILALTANVAPDVMELVITNGMDGMISKPFNPDHLLETMLRNLKSEALA